MIRIVNVRLFSPKFRVVSGGCQVFLLQELFFDSFVPYLQHASEFRVQARSSGLSLWVVIGCGGVPSPLNRNSCDFLSSTA